MNKRNKKEKVGEKRKEASDMFDLIKDRHPVRNEPLDVKKGLSQFTKETGVDFLRLMNDVQYRSKVLVNGNNKTDTDEDELALQKVYEPLQRKLLGKE